MAKKRTSTPRRRKSGDQFDVAALLSKTVNVAMDGHKQRMTACEISLRAQVKKALKDHNLSAIMSLLAVAAKHGLVKPPPKTPEQGGVLIWPRLLTAKFGDDLFGEVPKAKTDSNRNDEDDK